MSRWSVQRAHLRQCGCGNARLRPGLPADGNYGYRQRHAAESGLCLLSDQQRPDHYRLRNRGQQPEFGYDSLQRLSSATGGYGTLGFTYDANGNRLSQTHGIETTNYRYGSGSDLLATLSVGGVQTQAIGYMADGRIASLSPGIQAPGGQYITLAQLQPGCAPVRGQRLWWRAGQLHLRRLRAAVDQKCFWLLWGDLPVRPEPHGV